MSVPMHLSKQDIFRRFAVIGPLPSAVTSSVHWWMRWQLCELATSNVFHRCRGYGLDRELLYSFSCLLLEVHCCLHRGERRKTRPLLIFKTQRNPLFYSKYQRKMSAVWLRCVYWAMCFVFVLIERPLTAYYNLGFGGTISSISYSKRSTENTAPLIKKNNKKTSPMWQEKASSSGCGQWSNKSVNNKKV